jgi:Ni,Fe-hydrogenase I cytochrome b subunit
MFHSEFSRNGSVSSRRITDSILLHKREYFISGINREIKHLLKFQKRPSNSRSNVLSATARLAFFSLSVLKAYS